MDTAAIEARVRGFFSKLTDKQKISVAGVLNRIIDEEILGCILPAEDPVCPVCGSTDLTRYGRTSVGTQRWRCGRCGSVRCRRTGLVLANTKLDRSQWLDFVPLFIDHLPSRRVAEKVGVTMKTAWFMRIRMLEALFPHLPAFQVGEGDDVEVDEIYFRESFKGLKVWDESETGRAPRTGRNAEYRRGISNDQVCVLTAVSDSKDFFFDVVCRGAMTSEMATASLKGHIMSGAVVTTDRHKAYPSALKNLGTAVHNAFRAGDHEKLDHINHVHSNIRTFMAPFRGVSTKWLHLYLGWFKWISSFGTESAAAKQMATGDYVHSWRMIQGRRTLRWTLTRTPVAD